MGAFDPCLAILLGQFANVNIAMSAKTQQVQKNAQKYAPTWTNPSLLVLSMYLQTCRSRGDLSQSSKQITKWNGFVSFGKILCWILRPLVHVKYSQLLRILSISSKTERCLLPVQQIFCYIYLGSSSPQPLTHALNQAHALSLSDGEEEAVAIPYRKMLQMMIPVNAVRHKMTKDNVSEKNFLDIRFD